MHVFFEIFEMQTYVTKYVYDSSWFSSCSITKLLFGSITHKRKKKNQVGNPACSRTRHPLFCVCHSCAIISYILMPLLLYTLYSCGTVKSKCLLFLTALTTPLVNAMMGMNVYHNFLTGLLNLQNFMLSTFLNFSFLY